jgi:hypothetical protein
VLLKLLSPTGTFNLYFSKTFKRKTDKKAQWERGCERVRLEKRAEMVEKKWSEKYILQHLKSILAYSSNKPLLPFNKFGSGSERGGGGDRGHFQRGKTAKGQAE